MSADLIRNAFTREINLAMGAIASRLSCMPLSHEQRLQFAALESPQGRFDFTVDVVEQILARLGDRPKALGTSESPVRRALAKQQPRGLRGEGKTQRRAR